jgi:hypothetical protein
MPQILELKNIDGQMWARLEIDFETTPQPVSLLTKPELDSVKRSTIINELEELAENFEGAGADAPWRGQEIADAIRERIKNHPRC